MFLLAILKIKRLIGINKNKIIEFEKIDQEKGITEPANIGISDIAGSKGTSIA